MMSIIWNKYNKIAVEKKILIHDGLLFYVYGGN